VKQLDGAVAFVTGGGNGIGRAVVLELARAGTHVAVADVDVDAASSVAAGARALGVGAVALELDVRDAAAFEAAAVEAESALGPVRLLHANAGIALVEPVATTTAEDWRWVIDVNLFGVVNGVRTFLPRMLALDGERHIVSTASAAGLYAQPMLGAYNASKYAVTALCETLHEELAPHGIGVSVLCPGMVATRIGPHSARLRAVQHPAPDQPHGRAPAGDWATTRVVSPDDVARIVVQGVRDGELYLLTHPEQRELVEQRFAGILAAYDRAAARDTDR
jgi:NAD(P)-dependent dehydrogenase (short-subunit alcohol dehydrogenase family)